MIPRIFKAIGFTAMSAMLISMFMVGATFAQVGATTVRGTVTDAQGAVVAGATVRLINDSKAFVRTAVTSNNGGYTFTSVPPDIYRIEVEAEGFKKTVLSNVAALVDKPTDAGVALEVGAVTEVVNVSGADLASIVNTQDASLGNNFVSQQILQLPLQGRNVANLLSAQAGVTPDGSVTGARSDQSNITLDGVDVNNQQEGFAFSPVLRVNPDSVDEFRVTTANPDATRGRSSGAQISLITKSGSNDFRGALYNYHRNTATTANNFFNNRSGLPNPKLIRNLFGGRLSGPIAKDRLFFFYNYEGMRESKSASVARVVPSASLAAGNVQFRDNTGQDWTIPTAAINTFTLNGVPVHGVNPAVTQLFSSAVGRYTINDSTLGDGRNTGGFRFNAPVPVDQNAHTARFDWVVTSDQRHNISVRGNYQQDITGAAPFFPDTPPTNQWSHPTGYMATHTWLISNNVTNRFSYGRTRLAFSNQGDSADPAITFRFIFQPVNFSRTFSRVNPTDNFTNDLTWITGNHTFQFGTNIRLIENKRTSFARAFDNGTTNPSAYASNVAKTVIDQYISAQTGSTRSVASAWSVSTQGALVALWGRLNGYGANFNFNVDGSIQGAGEGVTRIFKTEEYDFYAQDAWKISPNVTLTLGLRYGLSMPVTETQGFETVPNIVLSEYLDRRIAAMNQGQNYTEPISIGLAGKANGLDSIYPLDKNNFQPRVSIAWSPDFNDGFWRKVFGKPSDSVIRAGFSITNDYFGQQLAANWDGSNTLGFSSSSVLSVNTYNVTTNPAPLYTGPSMTIRNLPNVTIPGSLTFPQTQGFSRDRIETSLDQDLVSPINYSWNVSYGRQLPGKIWVDAAYIGRLARNLLAGRDVMMLANPTDPVSGMTWREATQMLDVHLQSGAAGSTIPNIPFFNNMWAPGSIDGTFFGAGWSNTRAMYEIQPLLGDWTYTMYFMGLFGLTDYFFQGQYGALNAYGTIGSSDYHGATLSLRQRLADITWDFNYTFSKSLDDASGIQASGNYGASFILDAFDQKASRSFSDFDIKHVINVSGIWEMPFGKGRRWGSGINSFADAILGGWQVSGVARYDSGRPFGGYLDGTGWATNWQIRSFMTQLLPVSTGKFTGTAPSSCTSGCDIPNIFQDPDAAWSAFRTPYSGETGQRNPFRYPGSFNVDLGLSKSFKMPWKEGHKIQLRWDVFNVTNTPHFITGTTLPTALIGFTGSTATGQFGRYTAQRNDSRIMQFALRYDF